MQDGVRPLTAAEYEDEAPPVMNRVFREEPFPEVFRELSGGRGVLYPMYGSFTPDLLHALSIAAHATGELTTYFSALLPPAPRGSAPSPLGVWAIAVDALATAAPLQRVYAPVPAGLCSARGLWGLATWGDAQVGAVAGPQRFLDVMYANLSQTEEQQLESLVDEAKRGLALHGEYVWWVRPFLAHLYGPDRAQALLAS